MNTPDTTLPQATLPELSEERIASMEQAVFAGIAADRTRDRHRRRRRTGWLLTAAAVIVVGAVAVPSLRGGSLSGGGDSAIAPSFDSPTGMGGDSGGIALESFDQASEDVMAEREEMNSSGLAVAPGEREIILSASATVQVDDVATAIRVVTAMADDLGGFVESSYLTGTTGAEDATWNGDQEIVYDEDSYREPGGSVTLRIPANRVDEAIAAIAEQGEVLGSWMDRYDVTAQTIDLRARVEAIQASVDRLTDLLAQAENVADLIAAESALTERQATLESYQGQLEALENQVAMSTLTVQFVPERVRVVAEPDGFWDGILGGWNALVATLNGLVIGLGFVLPWLAVIGVIGLVVWGVVRLVRRPHDARRTTSDATD